MCLVSTAWDSFEHKTDAGSEEEDKVWCWRPSEGADYWFDPGTVVRLRVERETWNNQPEATAPSITSDNPDTVARLQVPYSIEASMAEPGLGGEEWW